MIELTEVGRGRNFRITRLREAGVQVEAVSCVFAEEGGP